VQARRASARRKSAHAPAAGLAKVGKRGAKQGRAQLPAQLGQLVDGVGGCFAGLRVALPQERHYHLLDQAGLAFGRPFVGAKVTSLDTVVGEGPGQPRDHGGFPAVIRRTPYDPGSDEPVLLEVSDSLNIHAGLGYEFPQRQLVVGGTSYIARAPGPR
jgi:hypothetical protein